MWKWRAAMLLVVAAAIVGIILYDAGWARRETSAAFAARFGKVPQLSLDEQHHRGVICGSYKFPFSNPDRFIFVSHYSSAEYAEGLNVSADVPYRAKALALCEKA
jgi:hypothetical protein